MPAAPTPQPVFATATPPLPAAAPPPEPEALPPACGATQDAPTGELWQVTPPRQRLQSARSRPAQSARRHRPATAAARQPRSRTLRAASASVKRTGSASPPRELDRDLAAGAPRRIQSARASRGRPSLLLGVGRSFNGLGGAYGCATLGAAGLLVGPSRTKAAPDFGDGPVPLSPWPPPPPVITPEARSRPAHPHSAPPRRPDGGPPSPRSLSKLSTGKLIVDEKVACDGGRPAEPKLFTTLFQRPNVARKRALSKGDRLTYFLTGVHALPRRPASPEPEPNAAAAASAGQRARARGRGRRPRPSR